MCFSGEPFSQNTSGLASGLCSNDKLDTVSVYKPAALSRLESLPLTRYIKAELI